VEVTAFPLPARGWLARLVRTLRGVGAEAAEAALDRLPLRLADRLTRGAAEDLLALLARERVTAAAAAERRGARRLTGRRAPARRPRAARRAAWTRTSGSRAASGTSSWTRWACCWR
jgi:hypothetical protein